jgi:hypothetical protein
MGATQSAAEISMCSQAVFGTDVDILSWDYGRRDGKNHDKYLLHYGYRAALGPSFPVLVCVRGYEGKKSPQQQRLKELEDRDMSVFAAPDNKALRDAIPDTLGMSSEEIGQLPEYVQNFKCYGHMESGKFFCGPEKTAITCAPTASKRKVGILDCKFLPMEGDYLRILRLTCPLTFLSFAFIKANHTP